MAVSGVTGGGTSIYGSRNVLSGLASGMDTESMIENMTQATRLKIAQQKQKKTALGWKQSAYQNISTQLIEFSKKYMEYPSSTNLLSSSFFAQTIVTSVGKNSELVTGSGKSSNKIEVNGVKQLATNATHTASAFESKIETKAIGMEENITVHDLAGESLVFKYAGKRYSISLTQGADLDTVEKVAEEINKQLGKAELPNGGSLADKLNVTVYKDGSGKKNLVFNNTDKAGNELKLVAAGKKMEMALGTNLSGNQEEISISKDNPFKSRLLEDKDLTHQEKMEDFLVGKTMTFSLNGKSKTIVLLTKEEKAEMDKDSSLGKKNDFFQKNLQKKLNEAFGTGKIEVKFEKTPSTGNGVTDTGKLKFETPDKNNILRVEGGSGQLFGTNGAFGIEVGDSNRLNMNRTLEKLGIQFQDGKKQKLVINGIEVGEYDKDTKLSTIIKDINAKSELGITAKYSELTHEFVLSTKETGSNAKIEIAAGLGEKLFGGANANNKKYEAGKDAIVDVTIDGKRETITRDTNTIDINGFKVTVSGTFGDYKTGSLNPDPKETVSFNSKPDTEKVFDAIKEMVEEYNKLAESVYKQLTTKPDREYQPLTDEQKKEMTKEQIEQWEEKAKEGLLFMDSQMRSLHDALSSIFAPADKNLNVMLKNIGIEPVKDHKEGAKIRLDEEKLKEALAADPEKVKNAFNAPVASGNGDSGIQGGAFTNLQRVVDRFASTSMAKPGGLVALAGSPSSANSMLNNTIQKELEGIDKVLDNLESRLKKEIDRYNSKFTQLEMLISQMNAQSGQLAGLMGGGM